MGSYFKKRVTKDKIFDRLKADKNLMVTVSIPEGLAERATCSLKRKDPNTNKIYTVSIDEFDNTIQIPFDDLWNYNKSIIQMGSVILIQDSTDDDTAIQWLVDRLCLTSLYEVMASIFDSIDKNYSVKSIQKVIDNLVENKNKLNQQQLFVIRQMLNYNIIQNVNVSNDIVQELIPLLDNIFCNTSWSSDNRSTKRLFI